MKKVFIILITLVLFVVLVSCKSEEERRSEAVSFWTDPETGVQYIIYDEPWSYGTNMTPRLNKDGKPYIVTEKGGAE